MNDPADVWKELQRLRDYIKELQDRVKAIEEKQDARRRKH